MSGHLVAVEISKRSGLLKTCCHNIYLHIFQAIAIDLMELPKKKLHFILSTELIAAILSYLIDKRFSDTLMQSTFYMTFQ